MIKLPLSIAEKLLLLVNGEKIPVTKLSHSIIQDLIIEGILHRNQQSRTRASIQLPPTQLEALYIYLHNNFSINNLKAYVQAYTKEDLSRAEAVSVSSDSKLKNTRSFKGFLINCYTPIKASLNQEATVIFPRPGTFTFIYDFEDFTLEPDITIVGVENSENFRCIEKQQYLFKSIKPLFVSRYPQSKDLVKWLQSIPNNYLHFGDFDFAGINIYISEYKKYIPVTSSFFIPENSENLIKLYGNKDRYNLQKLNFDINTIPEPQIIKMLSCLHKYKKGLDQEILIHLY